MKRTRPAISGYLERILTSRVYDVAIESPLEPAQQLSRRLGANVLLKREDLQPVFSFKIRGAYNRMARLDKDQLKAGVVTASAGNHAQGVALAAQRMATRATIVMPVTTPEIKIDAVKNRGSEVMLHGDSYSDAYAFARALSKRQKRTFIHPYDDPEIIAGQGTVGMEILRQNAGPIEAIFVPIGGGGLIAGIAAYVKSLRPEIRIIGVEPVDSDAMRRSIAAGRIVRLEHVGLFADGVAVKQVGDETFRICREAVDDILLADTDDICAAIKDVFEDTRTVLEPAGALAVAGLKKYARLQRKKINGAMVAVTSGANMNFDRLRFVAERAEVGEQREALMAVTIPEQPGGFKNFCRVLGARHITEFNYRYSDPKQAHIFVGMKVGSRAETAKVVSVLRKAGYQPLDLTDNETAKLHVRHLVGGRAPELKGERLMRFEFPERPGALIDFLESMHPGWNITLFQYRNHGADYGRVLIGFQLPKRDEAVFARFLKKIGYEYSEESRNPVFDLFLK